MTNPARDFIEKVILPYARGTDGTLIRKIEAARSKWDTPSNPAPKVSKSYSNDHNECFLVDKEAFFEARNYHDYELNIWDFLQAYEQAKVKPPYRGGDKELVEDGILPKPLPELPEKIDTLDAKKMLNLPLSEGGTIAANIFARLVNQLIDFCAAIRDRGI